MSGKVGSFGSGNFGGVLDWGWDRRGTYGQVVGQDTEPAVIGGVADADFLSFWVDVSVAADLVTSSIAVVDMGLSGVSVSEATASEFVLGVVLAGGVCGVSWSVAVGKVVPVSHWSVWKPVGQGTDQEYCCYLDFRKRRL